LDLSFFANFCCPLLYISIIYAFLVLSVISWCFVLHIFGHFVNYIIPLSQFTFKLCLTNQLCPRNMSVPVKSITIMLIFSLYLLISTLSGVNHINSLFFVLFALNTLNNIFTSFVLIHSFLTSCLSIPVWVYSESTNTYSCSFFLFYVLILAYMFSSLSLLFLQYKITYWL